MKGDVIPLLDQSVLTGDLGRDGGCQLEEVIEGVGFGHQRKLVVLADPNMRLSVDERVDGDPLSAPRDTICALEGNGPAPRRGAFLGI